MHSLASLICVLKGPVSFGRGLKLIAGEDALGSDGATERESNMRAAVFFLLLISPALARDDGRYANNPLKQWFDSLKSGKGFCCSDADGKETEYDIRLSKYWVPVNGIWTEVPEDAVIAEPNKFGRPMLWLDPWQKIQCFIPGSGL
jgi:hypothetical protein